VFRAVRAVKPEKGQMVQVVRARSEPRAPIAGACKSSFQTAKNLAKRIAKWRRPV
jgi:hypothetical protein